MIDNRDVQPMIRQGRLSVAMYDHIAQTLGTPLCLQYLYDDVVTH